MKIKKDPTLLKKDQLRKYQSTEGKHVKRLRLVLRSPSFKDPTTAGIQHQKSQLESAGTQIKQEDNDESKIKLDPTLLKEDRSNLNKNSRKQHVKRLRLVFHGPSFEDPTSAGIQYQDSQLGSAGAQIKQEETEKFKILSNQSKDKNEIHVKQERNEDPKILSNQSLGTSAVVVSTTNVSNGMLPDELDPDFYCRVCKKKFRSTATYRSHTKRKHNMQLKPLKSNATPDFDDLDNYCSICDITLSHRTSFLKHLVRLHNMISKSRKRQLKINPDITPDVNDPNSYCCACDHTFSQASHYHRHLENIHHFTFNKGPRLKRDPTIIPDTNDPNNYCKSCKKTLANPDRYRVHLRKFHKMNVVRPLNYAVVKFRTDVDTSDPNNTYCAICKKTYAQIRYYREHVKLMHKDKNCYKPIHGKSRVNPDVEPDINDPNFYCKSCQVKLSTKSSFKYHLRYIHDMENIVKAKVPNFNIIPDVNDPDLYCASCDHAYTRKYTFKCHMEQIHGLVVPSKLSLVCEACKITYKSKPAFCNHAKEYHNSTLNPRNLIVPNFNILPDIDDADHYCRSCNHTLINNTAYRDHLMIVHGFKESQLDSSDPTLDD